MLLPLSKSTQASFEYLPLASSKISGQPIECLPSALQPFINHQELFYRLQMPCETVTLTTLPCKLTLNQSRDTLSQQSSSTIRPLKLFDMEWRNAPHSVSERR
ncbi:hypothetical protein TNCV_302741 [Trichonephila clavipes]|nr:hypothetical protein TNCV_302741 [Trichonephila clavipes]